MVREKRSQDMQPPDPYLRRQWGTSGLPLGRETAPNGLVGSPSANIDHGQGQHPSWLRRSLRPGARALTMTSLLLPSLLLILLINTYPIFYAAFQAVHNGSLISSGPFVGLSNFRAAIDDPVFWGAVRFTLIFTLAAVLGGWVIGFSLALLLWAPVPGRSVFRVLLLLPWIVPVVVSANSWNWLTATSTSVLPRLASALGFHNAALPGKSVPRPPDRMSIQDLGDVSLHVLDGQRRPGKYRPEHTRSSSSGWREPMAALDQGDAPAYRYADLH